MISLFGYSMLTVHNICSICQHVWKIACHYPMITQIGISKQIVNTLINNKQAVQAGIF